MQQYLIDTHTLLWHITDNVLLPVAVKNLIENTNSKITVSIVSIWEISIKLNIGKLNLEIPFGELQTILYDAKVPILPITFAHTQTYLTLAPHHKDPFDRMLIAQAITDNYMLIGADEIFDKYPMIRVW